MVGRALSERVKRQLSRRVKNTQMQMAIDEYRREQAKPEGVVDKAQRKVWKASKKARKVELEERWKAVCVAHEEAVVSWKARCEVLREGGTAAKNLPKKPKRVLKASLVEEDEDANEGGGSDEASDSDDE